MGKKSVNFEEYCLDFFLCVSTLCKKIKPFLDPFNDSLPDFSVDIMGVVGIKSTGTSN